MAELDCIILDFDGTFTDVEQEAVPFLEAYRDELTAKLGPEVTGWWDEVAKQIGENPNGFGWEFDGHIVAPSHADPYIMATSTAQKLLDDHDLLMDHEERRVFLDALFKANYPKARSIFRPEAKEVAERLIASGVPCFVVTNSHTEAVDKKLDELAPKGRDKLPVYGNAKKYVIAQPEVANNRFSDVPESLNVDGLERPIYLRRGLYYDVLETVLQRASAQPERTLVCGDIFELDLALPSALGYQIHLVARPGTPDYERDAVERIGDGAVSESLRPVLDYLGE